MICRKTWLSGTADCHMTEWQQMEGVWNMASSAWGSETLCWGYLFSFPWRRPSAGAAFPQKQLAGLSSGCRTGQGENGAFCTWLFWWILDRPQHPSTVVINSWCQGPTPLIRDLWHRSHFHAVAKMNTILHCTKEWIMECHAISGFVFHLFHSGTEKLSFRGEKA